MQPSENDKEWYTLMDLSLMLQAPYVDVLAAITEMAHDEHLKIKKPRITGQNWQWRLHREALPTIYQRLYGAKVIQQAMEQEYQNNYPTLPLNGWSLIGDPSPPIPED